MATRNEISSEDFNGRGAATSSGDHSISIRSPPSNPAAPSDPEHENKLNTFALRLAVLEKLGIMVGTLTFIWATVVLLGGFAITMKAIDFWFVTAILVIEGTRIFSRSHQLELQHQDKNDCSGSLIQRTAKFLNLGCFSRPDLSPHSTATSHGASHGKDTWRTNWGLRQSKMRKWDNLRFPILPWLEIRASNVLLLLELVQVLAVLATLASVHISWREGRWDAAQPPLCALHLLQPRDNGGARVLDPEDVLGVQHLLPACVGGSERKLGARIETPGHDPKLLLPALQHMPEPEHLQMSEHGYGGLFSLLLAIGSAP